MHPLPLREREDAPRRQGRGRRLSIGALRPARTGDSRTLDPSPLPLGPPPPSGECARAGARARARGLGLGSQAKPADPEPAVRPHGEHPHIERHTTRQAPQAPVPRPPRAATDEPPEPGLLGLRSPLSITRSHAPPHPPPRAQCRLRRSASTYSPRVRPTISQEPRSARSSSSFGPPARAIHRSQRSMLGSRDCEEAG